MKPFGESPDLFSIGYRDFSKLVSIWTMESFVESTVSSPSEIDYNQNLLKELEQNLERLRQDIMTMTKHKRNAMLLTPANLKFIMLMDGLKSFLDFRIYFTDELSKVFDESDIIKRNVFIDDLFQKASYFKKSIKIPSTEESEYLLVLTKVFNELGREF